jgi:hypothetical protein
LAQVALLSDRVFLNIPYDKRFEKLYLVLAADPANTLPTLRP